MKIAITGHRPNKLWNDYDLVSIGMQKIEQTLTGLVYKYEPDFMISGMALGIDTLWARLAVNLNIPLIAAIPFEGQEKKWPQKSQEVYLDLCAEASEIKFVCEKGYAAWKMQKRNEWLVNNCDILIAVWDGSPGGTSNCINYAKKVNKEIIYINPNDYK